MFCRHCGAAVTDDSKFCYRCGKQLYADVITKETPIGVFTSTVETEDSTDSQAEDTNNQYNFADYTNKPEDTEHSLIENVKVQDGFFFRHITKKKKVVYTLFAILIAIWTAVAVVMMFFPQYTNLL